MMPRFSQRSRKNLLTCHPVLVDVADTVILTLDHAITHGFRGPLEQNALFRARATKVKYPNSYHNGVEGRPPSYALDFQPYHPDFGYLTGTQENIEHIALTAGKTFEEANYFLRSMYAMIATLYLHELAKRSCEAVWGNDWDGDWNFLETDFNDLGHIQISKEFESVGTTAD